MNVLKLTKQVFILFLFSAVLTTGCKKDARVYDLLPPDPEIETDVTYLGTISVNIENSGGKNAAEGSTKLVDGDLGSKFLINPYSNTLYMQLTFSKAQRIAAYKLTSGNDASGRDPKNWKVQASNDGTTWVDLDTRTGEAFASRGLTKRYDFTNTKDYKIYRLSVTANNGDSLFQLGEWSVIRVPL
ncbi:discoidin domain-containing protein [Pedobacter psychrodurus]|uniref:discoidin domain-containing protein n=1 Tax=Pedobacter psychrodurus TaxID=2530456 RepID=UPI0029315650|nr:discoidin domain-containing protein [Pedobacter psychrodurus]